MVYGCYLLAIMILGISIVRKIDRTEDFATAFSATVAITMALAFAISGILILFRLQSGTAFGLVAIAACGVGLFLLRSEAGCSTQVAESCRGGWFAVAIMLLTPVAMAVLAPLNDVDSLAAFESVLAWRSGQFGVLNHVWNYPATWELIYVPALALGPSTDMLWFPGFLVVAAIACVGYSIARKLGLPATVAVICGFGALTHYTMWGGGSGAASLKNDMIVTFGTLMVVDGLLSVRSEDNPRILVIGQIGIGIAFVTIKYLGVVSIPSLLLLSLLLLGWNKVVAVTKWQPANVAMLTLPTLVLTAPYYIKNLVVFHNPLYPMVIRIAGIELPGTTDLKGTSIVDHTSDPEVWSIMLGLNQLHVSGLLFGMIWIAAIVALAIVLVRSARLRVRLRPEHFVVAAGAILFLFYCKSYWSAGSDPNNIGYLKWGNISSRYAISAIVLAEIGLLAIAWRFEKLRYLALAMLATQVLSRCYFLYFHFDRFYPIAKLFSLPGISVLMLAGGVVAVLVTGTHKKFGPVLSTILSAYILGMTGAAAYQQNASLLNPRVQQPAVRALRTLNSSQVAQTAFILDSIGSCRFWRFRYPLSNLEKVSVGKFEELEAQMTATKDKPDLVAIYRPTNVEPIESCQELQRVSGLLESNGYSNVLRGRYAAAWSRLTVK